MHDYSKDLPQDNIVITTGYNRIHCKDETKESIEKEIEERKKTYRNDIK
jgi:hypothetical protein